MKMTNILRKKPWLAALGTLLFLSSCGGDDESGQPDSGECSGCHTAQTTAWENFSSHKGIYRTCTFCHEEADPEPGQGHRTSPWCDQCHSERRHPPDRILDGEGLLFYTCVTCHDPMGSKNIYLIREEILVEEGRRVPVDFRNTKGRADYSYAELSAEDGGQNGKEAGSAICEVCHANTRVYNSTGTGGGHSRRRCSICHNHAIAFGVESAQEPQR
jgi:hypothetical protein